VFGEQLRSQLENETLEGSKSTRDSNVTPENAASRQTNDVSALTGEGIGRSEATRAVTLADPQKDVPVPTTDRARFVQRVANAFRSAQQQDGEIQLRLSPPELGSLKIEIAIRNGVLTANLETETSDARRVLLDNLPALRQRLAEQDIRIEKFEVDVRREGHSDHGQPEAEDRQSPRENRNSPTRRPEGPLETVVGSRRLPASAMSVPASGLDVRI
jgi:flagellar hook-length control protein FliK